MTTSNLNDESEDRLDSDKTKPFESTVDVTPSAEKKGFPLGDNTPPDRTIAIGDISSESKRAPKPINEQDQSTVDTVDAGATIDSVNRFSEKGSDSVSSQPAIVRSGRRRASDSLEEPNRSVLERRNVGATINPRELSDKDAELWRSLAKVGSQADSPSRLAPAIERSLRETNLKIVARSVSKGTTQREMETSDYQLVRLLGKGGMGNVYVARQGSLDRMIAVKVIRPLNKEKREKLRRDGRLDEVEEDRRQQFLSEAVVTGDLDHPNIVPVHDIAVMGDDTLFYAMKRVVGTAWNKVIEDKNRDENLEILLKVCDAVGFAHTRGVVHRDLKPENVMLGDFGVVMVMDWGLALPTEAFEKRDSVFPATGLGGTPAFMAPEMATGPIERITPASDVYLLGAILFMIITGNGPHHGETVRDCIKAVAANKIRDIDQRHRGELMNIALRAMQSNPEDRYPDVVSFQEAIREYRSHSESISLATRAIEDLEKGKTSKRYADFSRAIFGFEEALSLWSGNRRAEVGLEESRLLYAETAYGNEDFDNGLQVLDRSQPTHQMLIEKLEGGLRERAQRLKRISLLRQLAVAMLAFILVGGGVALWTINEKRAQAERAEQIAVNAKIDEEKQKIAAIKAGDIARQQEAIAKAERANAEMQERIAKDALIAETEAKTAAVLAKEKEVAAKLAAVESEKAALEARDEAHQQRELAEYEGYLSNISLAKARIERNNFDKARETLANIVENRKQRGVQESLPWEFRWLARQAHQSHGTLDVDSPVLNMTASRSGRFAIATTEAGEAIRISVSVDNKLTRSAAKTIEGESIVTAAISEDEKWVALGTESGSIEFMDSELQKKIAQFHGHTQLVSSLHFMGDDYLVSASHDRTFRVFDLKSSEQVAVGWHIAPVRQLDIASVGIKDTWVLATVVADASSGHIAIWELNANGGKVKATRSGTFDSHKSPVSSIALSSDGQLACSGDEAGGVLLWRPASVDSIDYSKSIPLAIKNLSTETIETSDARKLVSIPLIDSEAHSLSNRDLLHREVSSESDRPSSAHSDAIRSIQFSQDDAKILTASDDFTIKVWGTQSRKMQVSIRGHGGWVSRAEFLSGEVSRILSGSGDQSLRTWTPKTYVGGSSSTELISINSSKSESKIELNLRRAHNDEIWSARFSHDGRRLVTASRDRTAKVLDIDRGTLELTEAGELNLDDDEENRGTLIEGTSFVAMSMALDRNCGRLFVGSADASVRIWDLERGTEIGKVRGTGLNQSMALSRSGKFLATGSSSKDAKAVLWSLQTIGLPMAKPLFRFKGHDQAVTALAVSDDDSRVFTGDREGRGILWDAKTGEPIGLPIDDLRGYRINAASFVKQNDKLLIAADDQTLSLLDLQTRRRTSKFNHEGVVTSVSTTPNGRFALTVSELTNEAQVQTVATLWDLENGEKRVLSTCQARRTVGEAKQSSEITQGRISSAQFSSDGSRAMVSQVIAGGDAPRIMRWEIGTRIEQVRYKPTLELPAVIGSPESVLPLSDDEFLTLNGDSAFLWDIKKQSHVRSFRANGAVKQASFSFDGKWIATGSQSIKIWDAVTLRPVGKLEVAHEGPVRTLEFSPSRSLTSPDYRIVSGGDDGMVRLWNWDPSQRKLNLNSELKFGPAVRSVCMSQDGHSILAAGAEGMMKLWRIGAPTTPIEFKQTNGGELSCCAISGVGSWVAAGSSEALAYLWKVPEDHSPVPSPIELRGHSQRIEDIAILQTKTAPMRIFTSGEDQSTRVWDPRLNSQPLDSGLNSRHQAREVLVLERHESSVTACDLTENGELLLTASRDGSVILWPSD